MRHLIILVKQISTYALNLQFHHIHFFPYLQSELGAGMWSNVFWSGI